MPSCRVTTNLEVTSLAPPPANATTYASCDSRTLPPSTSSGLQYARLASIPSALIYVSMLPGIVNGYPAPWATFWRSTLG